MAARAAEEQRTEVAAAGERRPRRLTVLNGLSFRIDLDVEVERTDKGMQEASRDGPSRPISCAAACRETYD